MYRTVLHRLSASVVPFLVVVGQHWKSKFKAGSHVRGDTVIAIGVPIACIGLLVEAYYRTDYNDADDAMDAQFIPSNDCISTTGNTTTTNNNIIITETTTATSPTEITGMNTIVQILERDGIVIIPNAISSTMLNAVRDNIHRLQHHEMPHTGQRSFAASGNDTDVRQDQILWVRTAGTTNIDSTGSASSAYDNDYDEEDSENMTSNNCADQIDTKNITSDDMIGTELEYCIRLIRGIPYALEMNGYSVTNQHRIPQQCQLALYSGNNIASYQRHLDTCRSTIYELGILEYLRLSDYRQRRITIILYLNEHDRQIQHGGILRCWVSKELSQHIPPTTTGTTISSSSSKESNNSSHKTNENEFYPSFDVPPHGGTLVIFQSNRVEHQVLPSSVDRYALTNWVNSTV